jgi:vancomycin permeability regulator SanA
LWEQPKVIRSNSDNRQLTTDNVLLRRWISLFANSIPRGIALFLGVFGLTNLLGEFVSPGFDANLWWIDLPGCSDFWERAFLGWSALCLLWYAGTRSLSFQGKIVQTLTLLTLFEASVWNAATVSNLIAASEIQCRSPVSFSACVTVALALVLCGIWSTRSRSHAPSTSMPPRRFENGFRIAGLFATAVACSFLFPVAQMYCFGGTDYRREADVIVILGAKVYSNGAVSVALDQRLQTGCELYHQGFAPRILMSGGPGLGTIHETEAMRDRAIELGVPASAIFVDREGLDTQATATNAVRMCRERGWQRGLAVSQFYHLPRVKLAFHRQGMEVYTVPAVETLKLPKLPYYMVREVAALWLYYFRGRS